MKCIFLFLFVLLFGFFDFYLLFVFYFFFIIFFVLNFNFFWFGGLFFCDSLSFFLLFLVSFLYILCMFSSLLENWNLNFFWSFSFLFTFIFFILLLCFLCFSVFLFYIFFELIFLLMFIFLLSWGHNPERLQASFYMFFYTVIVSFPFLIFIVFSEYFVFSLKFLLFPVTFSYSWFLVFLVFLVKLPVYGVHLWLPKAHVEAPVSGSMLLAGILLKLGGYGFLRFSVIYFSSFVTYGGYFLSIGLLGGLISCFVCLRQSDLKAFVAYSSVCHMGFSLAGLCSFSYFGFYGMTYMMIGHGFCSSCLFYLLYLFYERYHSRSLFLLKGVGGVSSIITLILFMFSILNIGVPPSLSFFSEVMIVVGILGLNFNFFLCVGLFLFFSGVYSVFFYAISCHGISFLEGIGYNINLREFLNIYGHFFPLFMMPFFMSMYFFY